MKRIFVLFILTSLTIVSIYGQNWVKNDAVWHYDYYVTGSGFYKIEIGTDTIIQNKNCQKYLTKKYVFYLQPAGMYLLSAIDDISVDYTYTSGDTVFYYANNKFYTLYNFNANIGDEWVVNDEPNPLTSCDTLSKVKVIDTASFNINGINRRAILLETVVGSPMGIDGWIVENVGSIGAHLLFPSARVCNDTIVACEEQLVFKCFQDSLIGLYNPSGIECEYLLIHEGIAELKNQLFDVYPNPTSDFINIELRETGEYQLTLFDQSGRVIKSEKLTTKKEKINLTGFPNGVYTLRIESDKGGVTSKIIIKK